MGAKRGSKKWGSGELAKKMRFSKIGLKSTKTFRRRTFLKIISWIDDLRGARRRPATLR
jgi:hypothetical protein